MKTRKKEIDVHKLLGISVRSKKIPNISKGRRPIIRKSDEIASVNVSDKENVSSRPVVAKVVAQERRVLSPLRPQVLSPLKQATERNVRESDVVLSPLSSVKKPPGATSTPNVVPRTLFLEPVVETEEREVGEVVLLSDSDCTDTELEAVDEVETGKVFL